MSESSLIQVSDHPVSKTLASAANLANLRPTSTVLAFNALIPSFSNNGSCLHSNKFLTSSAIVVCAFFCLLFSFTDSFTGSDGKLYHGIATFRGLYIFNYGDSHKKNMTELSNYKIGWIDFVHAFLSVLVFLIFAIGNSDVQTCLIHNGGPEESALMMNLPLGVGVLASFLFTIIPTTRSGIG